MCGGNKGTTTSQTSQTAAPNPQAAGLYSSILGQAQGVAATPYQPFTGQQVAPINAQQTTGINAINAEQPVFGQATDMMQQASQPITAAQISQYESPYTQQVVNATQAEFNNQNAQQQQGVLGNAVAQGALGGNRTGIAQAELANQQSLAQAPVIANLENQGYTTGLNTALTEQQAQQQGALGLDSTANAALSGANAQIGAGTLQQQTQQAQDTAQYQNYLNAMGYPFQTTQWLAGIGTGVGSQMGGTTAGTGSTTVPPPSIASDLLGAGTAALGVAKLAALSTGGAVNRAAGGGVADGPDYPTIPEASHTLHAQQKQLVSGDRHVQMFPHGTKELPLPHGMKRVQSHSGTFHYNPQHVTASDIHNHSKSGHEHALLGLGPFSKHEIMHRLARGEHALAIVERNEHGHEVRAALGTHNTAHVQAHHMNRGKSKGHTVHIEFPHKVLGDRMAAHRQTGGSVTGSGGVAGLPPVPYTGGTSYIPGANITPGQGAPATSGQPPKPPSDPSLGNNTNSLANIFAGLNKKDSSGDTTGGVPLTSGISSVPADSGYVQTNSDDNYDANSSYDYPPDTDAAEENAEAGNSKRGGRIRGYTDGGDVANDPGVYNQVATDDPNAGVATTPSPDDVAEAHRQEAIRQGIVADQAAFGNDTPSSSPPPDTTTVPATNALDPNSVPLPRSRPTTAPQPQASDVGVAPSVPPGVAAVPTAGSTPAGVTAGSTPVATSSLTTAPSTQPTRDTSNDLFGVPAEDVAKASVATKHLESGGKYQNFKTTTNRQGQPQTALGAYGVMDFNLPQWSQEALGYKVSPQEFLNNSDIQDQIYKYKMSQYISKYGMEGAGRAWLGGEGALMAPNRKDPLGTTVGGYGSQFAQMADPEGKYSAKAFSHANPPGAATSDNQGVATPSNTQGVATPPNDSGNQKSGFLDKIFAKDPDLGMALISAGGAMLSSRSPYLAQGLGAGMQTGVGTYYGMKEREQEQALNQQKVNLEANRLGNEAAFHEKQLNETALYHGQQQQEKREELTAKMMEPKPFFNSETGQMDYTIRTPEGDVTSMATGKVVAGPHKGQMSGATGVPGAAPTGGQQSGGFTQAAFDPDKNGTWGVNVLQTKKDPTTRQPIAPTDYSTGMNLPYIEQGMDVPEPKMAGGKSPGTIKAEAAWYLKTGKYPPLARGNNPVALMQNAYTNSVMNYGNAVAASRGMTPDEMADIWQTAPKVGQFILGAPGNQIVSLGTAMRHLEVLKAYEAAWQQKKLGDTQPFNRLQAYIKSQWGDAAATNVNTAAQILGPEIVKAIGIAGAGSDHDRQGATNQFSTANSDDQVNGAIGVVENLMRGQLTGKVNQAKAAGLSEDRLEKLIGENEYKQLQALDGTGATPATNTPPPNTPPPNTPPPNTPPPNTPPPPAPITADARAKAEAWLAKNPNDPRASGIRATLQ